MPLEPFDPQLVVNRIAAQCRADDGYHLVDFAADNAAAIAARTFAMPAAFVLEPSFSANTVEQSESGFIVSVPHTYEVGVLTIVQNFGGSAGGHQSATARALRVSLWRALLGWAPEAEGFVFDLSRGQLLDMDEACFFYLDVFQLKRIIRSLI